MRGNEALLNESRKLENLDNLLKCGICYEYLKTTLITPCSHNFCSYCIRQSLMYKNQCPSCFEDTHEAQLRNNRVVDELILIFTSIKETLFKLLKYTSNSKQFVVNLETDDVPSKIKNSKDNIPENIPEPTTLQSRDIEVNHGNISSNNIPSTSKKSVVIPALFSPKKPKTLNINETKVSCPVCSVEIPEKSINLHLDACLKRTQEKRIPHKEQRKLLPKLVYHLLPDKDLRKKLSELGLSVVGDRNTLINRHRRYTLLYNSECDSLHPRPVSDIIKQMKKEEEDDKKSVPTTTKKLNIDRKADPQVIEEAQRQYLQEHKSSFQKLIEEARRRKETRKRNSNVGEPEQPVVTIDESSNSSESEFQIKRPSHKRKLIVDSDGSEGEAESNQTEADGRIATGTDSNVYKVQMEEQTGQKCSYERASNKENEIVTLDADNSSKIESSSSVTYDDSTDIESDDSAKNIRKEVASKCTRKSNDVRTLQPSTCSNSLVSATSPVLGSKCRSNKTPVNISHTDSLKRHLMADTPERNSASHSPHGIHAGHGLEEKDEDSDSSSNHSTSLLVYTGPDFDGTEQSKALETPNKSNCSVITTPTSEKCHFDLGIEDILQNSEEFESLGARRCSTRRKEANTGDSRRGRGRARARARGGGGDRVLRKRVRLDDL